MAKYCIWFGKLKNGKGTERTFLGEIDYPYELRKGNVVIIGEKMMQTIADQFPDIIRQQYWVATVHHFLSPGSNGNMLSPDIYITEECPE